LKPQAQDGANQTTASELSQRQGDSIPSTARIEAFSDGVIAIALTILVLELKVPEIGASLRDLDIVHLLEHLLPRIATYLLSFLLIAIYWVNHHHLFHLLERSNSGLLWANNHLLLWLSLLSFPTALLGEHPDSQVIAAIYGAVSFMTAVSFTVLHRYAYHAKLFVPTYSPSAFKADSRANLMTLCFYAVFIGSAFLNPYLAEGGYAFIALMYFMPRFKAR
jgi:uncharacterized membrane protein